jgi:hypothetical protein
VLQVKVIGRVNKQNGWRTWFDDFLLNDRSLTGWIKFIQARPQAKLNPFIWTYLIRKVREAVHPFITERRSGVATP